MPALVVLEGPNRGAIHTLLPDSNRLGRDPGCEVPVLDERASREHATVSLAGDGSLRLKDAGSRNGTWLNGVRCEDAPLRAGDEVRIGDTAFLFVSGREALAQISRGASTVHVDLAQAAEPEAAQPLTVRSGPPLLGDSPPWREVQRRTLRIAPLDASVLILGESGTGKELVAQAIHRNSARRAGPFVPLNGAALGGELLESELFGHEKGAFTGAVARRKGAFELARGGTLFLDEVGELPLGAQAALLRVLEGHGFRRLGGSAEVQPDVRLVAATNRDLPAAIAAGTFREDLYFRLEVARLELPPLRERPGDARVLAEAFLQAAAQRAGSQLSGFSGEALAALDAYPFPGNVRELKNLVERLVIFAEDERVELADLPREVRAGASPAPTPEGAGPAPFPSLRDVERDHVAKALERTGWNKTQAAKLLGIDRVTLYKRIARYELAP